MDGWIKIYRKLKDWEWYQDSNVVHVFIHLLLSAPFADTRKRGTAYKAGQIVTSLVLLAAELDKSYPTILRCIKILTESGAIDTKSTNKKTIITIRNFAKYQQDKAPCYKNNLEQDLEQPLYQSLEQTLEQPLQPYYNKNIKNNKNVKNNVIADKTAKQPKPTVDYAQVVAELEPSIRDAVMQCADAVESWVDYKKTEFRKSYKTATTFKAFLVKLYTLGNGSPETMKAIIEQSIANQYQGIFELKKSNNYGAHQYNNPNSTEYVSTERISDAADAMLEFERQLRAKYAEQESANN